MTASGPHGPAPWKVAMQYVGDVVVVTFQTVPAATVQATVTDPSGTVVAENVPVAESVTTPGTYPYELTLTAPNIWTVLFTASGTVTKVQPMYVRALPIGPPPLATLDEVIEGLGVVSLTPQQEQLALGLLRRASAMVRAHPLLGDFEARIAAGTLDPSAPGEAVLNMVLRVMRNPAGLRSEAAGPFSRAYDLEAASALLRITDAEMDVLLPGWDEVTSLPGTAVGAPSLMGYEPWHDLGLRRKSTRRRPC